MKIKLVTPIYRYMESITMKNIMQVIQGSKHHISWGLIEGDSFIQRVRDDNARPKEGEDFDYLMFIDDDICWQLPFNPIDKLVEADVDIASGVYVTRGDHYPVYRTFEDQEKAKQERYDEIKFEIGEGLTEVLYTGTGFMLVKTSVLKKMYEKYKYPFMSFEGETGEELSEDYAFCQRAHDEGFKIWVDKSVLLGHIGKAIFTLKDYVPKARIT